MLSVGWTVAASWWVSLSLSRYTLSHTLTMNYQSHGGVQQGLNVLTKLKVYTPFLGQMVRWITELFQLKERANFPGMMHIRPRATASVLLGQRL